MDGTLPISLPPSRNPRPATVSMLAPDGPLPIPVRPPTNPVDNLREFVSRACDEGPSCSCTTDALFGHYCRWAGSRGITPISLPEFTCELTELPGIVPINGGFRGLDPLPICFFPQIGANLAHYR